MPDYIDFYKAAGVVIYTTAEDINRPLLFSVIGMVKSYDDMDADKALEIWNDIKKSVELYFTEGENHAAVIDAFLNGICTTA